ncbi:MAG: glycine zipper 2TM domain-containing protein [Rhodospirillaceae bacterium]|jgi:surface antigen|nr:glycine zipper 2TM domain-containing protein [Rhodospirillaceae bacterium]MBT7485626.1 glycine zipper 2TM domain-containing protein [Rhodospirillales bacterium]MBT4699831.1 glycine zipper 2TM domain-containing protein [Rhodospirillaceae bacterium]MBT5035709.1 glycine zipper 2TM domain-containing protein [Rhodospirillaceae bacterium]MBT6218712.1 glycine zipper 2TM domain-containing protein [Rhodospirillaceae bacterium]
MKFKNLTVVLLSASLLGACAQDGTVNKEGIGTLVGAGLGALVGSRVGGGKGRLAAVALGALGGAYLGSKLGQQLDAADRARAERAQEEAHTTPVGKTIAWNNPDSGNSGTFTPTRDGTDRQTGNYCREYKTTINVGGKYEEAYGTACRQADGTWRIQK